MKWWFFGALVGRARHTFSRARSAGRWRAIPTGLWFLYQLRAAVERCDAMGHTPRGGCEIYGVPEQAIAMGLYVAVGVGLTAYAALRSRTARV